MQLKLISFPGILCPLKTFSPLQVLYRYESLAGYGLMILGPAGWCMFIYSTFFTLKHYPEKGAFYYPFFSYYTIYFIAGPTIIVIANHVIAEWVREKVNKKPLTFFAIPGDRPSACTTWPLSRGRGPLSHHCDLEAGYEGGVCAPKLGLHFCFPFFR